MIVVVPVDGSPRCPKCNKRHGGDFEGRISVLCKCGEFTHFQTASLKSQKVDNKQIVCYY